VGVLGSGVTLNVGERDIYRMNLTHAGVKGVRLSPTKKLVLRKLYASKRCLFRISAQAIVKWRPNVGTQKAMPNVVLVPIAGCPAGETDLLAFCVAAIFCAGFRRARAQHRGALALNRHQNYPRLSKMI
jgi:hypothetical protein